MDFYDRLIAYKALNKLGFREIGDIVDMSEAAIRQAVKRKSLNRFQIQELEIYFELDKNDVVSEPKSTDIYSH